VAALSRGGRKKNISAFSSGLSRALPCLRILRALASTVTFQRQVNGREKWRRPVWEVTPQRSHNSSAKHCFVSDRAPGVSTDYWLNDVVSHRIAFKTFSETTGTDSRIALGVALGQAYREARLSFGPFLQQLVNNKESSEFARKGYQQPTWQRTIVVDSRAAANFKSRWFCGREAEVGSYF